jgi:hypothetical protein
MADVYANSYLTISTSTSRDTNSGCFVSVTEQKVTHLALELLSLERESLGNTSAIVFTQQGSDVLEYLHQQPIAILDVLYD